MKEHKARNSKESSNSEPKGIRPRRGSKGRGHTEVAEIAIKKFVENPAIFWSSCPELAQAIESHIKSSVARYKRTAVFEGYMTERERTHKQQELSGLVNRYKKAEGFTKDDAIQALELAAKLREHANQYKDLFEKILESYLDIPGKTSEPQEVETRADKGKHHTYEIIRGVTLNLSWDGKLVDVVLDRKEYQARKKALSAIGIAADSRTDVAEKHDNYLWNDQDER